MIKHIISQTRGWMQKEKIDALLVNSTNQYLSEYNPLYQNARYQLTGFSGSTGEALITKGKVFVFVDGRYHKQAEDETDPNLVNVVKIDMAQSQQDAIIQAIKQEIKIGGKIAIASKKVSLSAFKKLSQELEGFEIIEYNFDPVLSLISKQTTTPCENINLISKNISGKIPQEKLKDLQKKLRDYDLWIMTKLEEISYITNLRDYEIPFCSSIRANAIIDKEMCYIFTDLDCIPKKTAKNLGDNFAFISNSAFEDFIATYRDKGLKIGCDASTINLYTYRQLESTNNSIIEASHSPIAAVMSVKNQNELQHFKENFLRTDIVISRLRTWLNQNLEAGKQISELDVSNQVKQYFIEQGATALSFEVIAARAKNSAIIHYSNPNSDEIIKEGDFLLLDCGGYFEGGYATDITRTLLAGSKSQPNDLQKKVYTTVLKAFLHGLNYPLTSETTGYDIDNAVREVINSNPIEGFSFPHSTGHGVGISVHESPPRISPSELCKSQLKPGMVFTIEPGLYNDNWGGVRLENTVYILEKDGKLQIQSLVKSSFEDRLVEPSLLNEQEQIWFKEYQKKAIE